ncbi:hypothetical protein [Vreelandella neptunia]|uniref:Yip1 domain-containing protein n=1 Tax=Vreelandella neptunia TaxID=115551 RepID=A0ABS9SD52_9GAMM|nr:hypothetical protein [Halomonas neptunia]MCH4814039.1 hypothetical protein [Halomonas neptunia]
MNAVVTFLTTVPEDYQAIHKELKNRGLKHLKTLFFFSYFTLGFAFFNLYYFGEYNTDAIISVLFNERLLAYSVITTLGFLGFYILFSALSLTFCGFSYLAKAFRWIGECCYEFAFGLIVVYLVGFMIDAPISVGSMPWLDLTQRNAYVLFNIFVLFLAIALELLLFVDKKVKKKSTCLALVLFVSAGFFLGYLTAS